MDRTTKGQSLLRRIALFDVDMYVHQDGETFEISASRDDNDVKLSGRNLETLAKELARKLGIDLSRWQ